jgi:iron complex transport system permease protein
MGYESVYLLWQALLLFMLGAHGLTILSISGNFIISITIMLIYSWALHYWLLPKCKNNIYMLLLFGLVLTTVLATFTQFIQLSISPGEFSIFQGLSYTSFNRSKPEMLISGALAVTICLWMGRKTLPVLDVMSLGREQSMSLGVDHPKYIRLYLALIAVLVAVSTSLIGPTGFMGIFIANIAYTLAGSNKHKAVIPIAFAVSLIIFLVAQLFVEHIFNYKTSVSILVNLVCGIYFLALIVRTRGTA